MKNQKEGKPTGDVPVNKVYMHLKVLSSLVLAVMADGLSFLQDTKSHCTLTCFSQRGIGIFGQSTYLLSQKYSRRKVGSTGNAY